MLKHPTIVTLDALAEDVNENVSPGTRARRSLLDDEMWIGMSDQDVYGPLNVSRRLPFRGVPVTSQEVAEAVASVDQSLIGWYTTMEYTAAGTSPERWVSATERPSTAALTQAVPSGPPWRGVRVDGDLAEFVESIGAVVRLRRRSQVAVDVDLDNLAAILSVSREPGESDDDLRARLQGVHHEDMKSWSY